MNKFEIRCNVIIGALSAYQYHDLFLRGHRRYDVPSKIMSWANYVRKNLAPKVRESDGTLFDCAQALIKGEIW